MKKLLFIFLLFPILAKSQSIITGDTTSIGIVYRNIADTTLTFIAKGTSDCDIDIDNDNIKDIRFSHIHNSSPCFTEITKVVSALSNLEFVLASNNVYADTISLGFLINKSLNWKNITSGNKLRYTFTYNCPPSPTTIGGDFITANNYLGFRKITATDTIYGWFLLDLTTTIKIKSFAYKATFTGIAVNHVIENIKLTLFPNPSKDQLFIQNASELDIKTCCLIAADGRELLLTKISDGKYDLSALPEGVYFLQVCSSKGVLTKRIVVCR